MQYQMLSQLRTLHYPVLWAVLVCNQVGRAVTFEFYPICWRRVQWQPPKRTGLRERCRFRRHVPGNKMWLSRWVINWLRYKQKCDWCMSNLKCNKENVMFTIHNTVLTSLRQNFNWNKNKVKVSLEHLDLQQLVSKLFQFSIKLALNYDHLWWYY